MGAVLALGLADVRRAVSMDQALAAAREAFVALSTQRAVVPLRTPISLEHGTTLVMPAWDPPTAMVGVKAVGIHPHNMQHGLPTVQGVVLLVEAAHGTPLAIIEGTFLTQL